MLRGCLDLFLPPAVTLAVAVGAGCNTTGDRAVEIVKEGRALLRHPAPEDPDWEADRKTFLEDADSLLAEVAPVTSKSRS